MKKTMYRSVEIDTQDFLLSIGDGEFVHVYEGTGDNLLPEDKADGYVDYVNYDVFKVTLSEGDPELQQVDGGMLLLKEFYDDLEVEDIAERVLDVHRHRGPYSFIGEAV